MSEELKAVKAQFEGRCSGGPYDGQMLASESSLYRIVMWCSTADDAFTPEFFEHLTRYQHTFYEFTDSTWVWRKTWP